MPRAKRGPALFELLDHDSGRTAGVKVPSWWSRPSQPVDLHAARAARAVEESPPIGEEEPPAVAEQEHQPLLEVEGDRVRVSLTSVRAGIAVFLGLAVVLAAYGLGAQRGDESGFRRGFGAGRSDGGSGEVDEITTLRSQPPASNLVGGLLQEPGTKPSGGPGLREDRPATKTAASAPANPPASAASATGWVRNLTYIVAQEFPTASLEKAKHAKEFLAQRGVNTELVPLNKDTTLLITTQGYSHADPAQKRLAEQLLEKVRTIGTQYYAAGGGYKLDGYFKTLKRDNW